MNGLYIRGLSEDELLERLLPFWQGSGLVDDPCPEDLMARLRQLVPIVHERLKRLEEIVAWTTPLLREIETPTADKLVGKKMTPQESLEALRRSRDFLVTVDLFEAEAMEQPLRDLADELGVKAGALFGILRWATTNQPVSPPLFGSFEFMGREKTLARLNAAEEVLAASV
jgi:glutamyl-tRNA synthetase